MKTSEKIRIVFDGPPGPVGGRFIEVENEYAQSISIGEWVEEGDLWYLEFSNPAQLEAELAKLNYIDLPNENVSNVFEAYLAWKSKANKLKAENEALRGVFENMSEEVANEVAMAVGLLELSGTEGLIDALLTGESDTTSLP